MAKASPPQGHRRGDEPRLQPPDRPVALADLIGLDVVLAVMEVFHRDFKDPKYRPAPLLKEMVAAGKLGRKSGRGFHLRTTESRPGRTQWT